MLGMLLQNRMVHIQKYVEIIQMDINLSITQQKNHSTAVFFPLTAEKLAVLKLLLYLCRAAYF
jgi:hypothetical protein